MTNVPGVPFEFQSSFHLNEHELQLTVEYLDELDRALTAMGNHPVQETHDDFVIVPLA